jgi:ABC-type molybdate transport system ATPase subunit
MGRVEPQGRAVRVLVRATDIVLANAQPSGLSIRTTLHGIVERLEIGEAPLAMLTVALDRSDRIAVAATRLAIEELALKRGDGVYLLVKTVALDERSFGFPDITSNTGVGVRSPGHRG